MQTNVGNLDRIARVIIGLILLSLPLWLATGLAGRCPGYRLLGMNTCPMHKKKPE